MTAISVNFPDRFFIQQPDFIDRRNDHVLLIWGDLPAWMIVDPEVLSLIQFFHKPFSLSQYIYSQYSANPPGNSVDLSAIHSVINNLKQKGLIVQMNNNSSSGDSLIASEENSRTTSKALQKKHQFHPIIENITINPTNRCNLRCRHCFTTHLANAKEEHVFISVLERFIHDAQTQGFLSEKANIAVLGGEPLLRKDLVYEIGQLGLNFKKEVIISTNGLLIDDQFARRARKLRLVVQISLDGATEATHERIRGLHTFARTIAGIRLLVSQKVNTIISMVVTADNFAEIEAFFDLGVALNVSSVRFIPLKQMGTARDSQLQRVSHKKILLAIDHLKQVRPHATRLIQRDFHSLMLSLCTYGYPQSHCGAGLKTLVIDADGQVYPCPNHIQPEFAIGNINTHSFDDLWLNSSILNNLRVVYQIDTNNPQCSQCCFRYWCLGGCRGETYENTHNMQNPAIDCRWIRDLLIETFWLLPRFHRVLQERKEYF